MSHNTKWYADLYYHVYNQGYNNDPIFYEEENYHNFLTKFSFYLLNYLDVIAYVLLPNHFHFLIKIKPIEVLSEKYFEKFPDKRKENDTFIDIVNKIVGNSFAAFFNSYTQSIDERPGSSLQEVCQKKMIDTNACMQSLAAYIHYNPVKHGIISAHVKQNNNIIDSLLTYKFSSLAAVYSGESTHMRKDILLEIFDGIQGFNIFHNNYNSEKIEQKIRDFIFED